jgi:RES domain-containing protein
MDIGSAWVKNNTSAVLGVPSVIIPGESNFLLNINHPNFKKIKIGRPEKFIFDRRMEK